MIAGVGHNLPPDEAAVARGDMEERVRAFLAGADVWSERPALDDELAPRARDFIAGAKKLLKSVDDARRAEKIPHERVLKHIDLAWSPLKSKLEKIIGAVEPKLKTYALDLQRRQDEITRQREAEARAAQARAAAEAAEAALARSESGRIEAITRAEESAKAAELAARAAADVEPARIESATGLARRVSLKTVRRARIVNLGLACAYFRERPDLGELIERLANADLRAAATLHGEKQIPPIPGIVWDESQELTS